MEKEELEIKIATSEAIIEVIRGVQFAKLQAIDKLSITKFPELGNRPVSDGALELARITLNDFSNTIINLLKEVNKELKLGPTGID